MHVHHRLDQWALKDPLFPKHMSFIFGPRQCGKTTLALNYLRELGLSKDQYYFNWDRADIRRKFREDLSWLSQLTVTGQRPLLVFDEIHKARQWKRVLKGIYDQYRDEFQFVVTGSGWLDHCQRGGDSLAGRYDPYQLFPFTPGELNRSVPTTKLSLSSLLDASLLPSKVSAPVSLTSIRGDVETSHATVKRYIATLVQLFMIFEVSPYSKKIHRPVKKEKKIYFCHHPAVQDEGARFENMVALILKRWVSEQGETANGDYDLCYLRDQDRREVNFLITLNQKPHFLFEVKRSDTVPSSSLRFYSEKLGIPGLQIVRTPKVKLKKGPNLGVLSIHALAHALG